MRTIRTPRAATLIGCAVLTLGALPATGEITGKLPGQVLAGGSNRVFLLNAAGEIVWEHPAKLVHDVWLLADGNVLFADGASVTEVTRDHKVVFRFESKEQRGGGAFACQRLENGNTVIGENSTGRILEVDRQGRVVFELQTSPVTAGAHHNMRMARKLASGNYLVCHSGANLVKEYAPDGKVVWEVKTPTLAFAAVRTAAGTTLISGIDRISEYDTSGTVVWQFLATEAKGVSIRNMTGLHLLANGNIAVGCYRAYEGESGSGLFEITRERAVVWRYGNPKADSSIMAVQRLDERGRALPGKCQR